MSILNTIKAFFTGRLDGRCDNCGATVKGLTEWDETSGGRFEGKASVLCSTCVQTAIQRAFTVSDSMVVVEPVADAHGYYFLDNDGIHEFWSPTEGRFGGGQPDPAKIEGISRELRSVVSRVSGKCQRCNTSDAVFAWVPAKAFDERWQRFFELMDTGHEVASDAMCAECTSKAVAGAIDRGISLRTIWPPSPSASLAVPSEA